MDLDRTLRLLRLEALAVEVLTALAGADVPGILVKGPVTNVWLYDSFDARDYGDIDLLVHPDNYGRACEILVGLGFTNVHDRMLGVYRPDNESAWIRDGVMVDLHSRLTGVPRRHAVGAAELLFAEAEPFLLQGTTVRRLSETDRVVHLGLHAAQSKTDTKALADLDVALGRLSRETWAVAYARAERLQAEGAFLLGVHQSSNGREAASQWLLPLPPPPALDSRLRVTGAYPESRAILALGQLPPRARVDEVLGWLRPQVGGSVRPRHRLAAGARLVVAALQIVRIIALDRLHPWRWDVIRGSVGLCPDECAPARSHSRARAESDQSCAESSGSSWPGRKEPSS